MKQFLRSVALLLFLSFGAVSFAQTNISGVINSYSPVSGFDTCANSITVGNPAFFSPGDTVLLIQMKGATIDNSNTFLFGDVTNYGSAGAYEFNVVQSVTGANVVLQFALSNTYDPTGSVQLITCPQYANATMVGDILPLPWNGTVGGVITFMVNGTLDMQGFAVRAEEDGFRGAGYVNVASSCNFLTNANAYFYALGAWEGSPKGEGIANFIPGREWGRGAQANGGGGGNDHNAGGGGGSNIAIGGNGGENQEPGTFNCKGFFPGIGGKTLLGNSTRLFMGGGGGAGHGNNTSNSDGGNGGGIIVVRANTVTGANSQFIAWGEAGSNSLNDGAGGGGGAGTIFLDVQTFAGTVNVYVQGGQGANAVNIVNRCYGPGGGGAGGRIYFSNTVGTTGLVLLNGGSPGITTGGTAPCDGSSLNATAGGNGTQVFNSSLVFSTNIPVNALTITCPPNQSLPADSGLCGTTINYPPPTTTGGCGPITVTRIAGPPTGTLVPVGNHTITFVANDPGGLTDTCSFLINVFDSAAPVIGPPGPIVTCNPNVIVPPIMAGDNCFVDSIANSFNGTNNASGIYPLGTTNVTWTVWDSSGNSSSVVQQITVNTASVTQIFPGICQGDTFFVGSNAYTITGNYSDTFSNAGCDSIVQTFLTVFPSFSITNNDTICDGDSIFLGGAWQRIPGTYFDTITTGPCDSFITTNLAVTPTPLTVLSTSICTGDSAFLGGSWQTVSGSYFDTLTRVNLGCDSVVRTDLTVIPVVTTSVFLSPCQGDSVLINGVWETTNGNYVDTLSRVGSGCDSLVQIALFFTPPTPFQIDTACCQNDSLFLAGAWRFFPGQYRDTLKSVNGVCDSVVQYNMILWARKATGGRWDTICQGDSIFLGGEWRSTSGLWFDTLMTYQGCDSVVSNFITVLPTLSQTLNPTICSGDTFRVGGNEYFTTGTYIDTLQTVDRGCDSIITTNLTVINSSLTQRSVAICQGDSLFLEGAWQTTSGVYNDTFTLGGLCDSIIETTLTVLPTNFTQLSETICQGDSLFAGGSWQTTTGLYYDTLQNTSLCDSVIETDLTVSAPPVSVQNITICQGDSYLAGGGNQTTSGIYLDTTKTLNGCDSIIQTNLTVTPAPVTPQFEEICQGDSIFIGGQWRSTAGVYNDTTQTALGCDSIIATNLTVNGPTFGNTSLVLCDGDSAFLQGAWQTSPGVYFDTLVASGGCDSILSTALSFQSGSFNQETIGICIGDSVFLGGAWRFLNGTYYDTVISPGGCVDITETRLFVSPPVVIISPTTNLTIPVGQTIQLEATGATTYLWTPDSSLSCSDCANPFAAPLENTTYIVRSADANGCPSIDSITIFVDTVGFVEIPNVFTPNGDGVNDQWYVTIRGVQGVEIQVYDRWGQKVFETNDANERWDGTFKGVMLDQAVYTYYIKLIYPTFQDDLTGNITLIR